MKKTELRISRRTRLHVFVKPGAWVDPDAVIKVIGTEKYRHWPDDVRLAVTGFLTRDGERYLLRVAGPDSPLLDLREQAGKDKASPLAPDLAGGEVEVEGMWRKPAGKDARPYLLLEKLTPVKSGRAAGGG